MNATLRQEENTTLRAIDFHKNFSEISFLFYCMLQWSHQLNLESHILFLEEWFHGMPWSYKKKLFVCNSEINKRQMTTSSDDSLSQWIPLPGPAHSCGDALPALMWHVVRSLVFDELCQYLLLQTVDTANEMTLVMSFTEIENCSFDFRVY